MIRLSIFYKKPGWIKGSCIVFAESDKTFVRKAVFNKRCTQTTRRIIITNEIELRIRSNK